MIQDEINKAILEISKKKEEIFHNALNYFQVSIEDVPERVKLYYIENGIEQMFIDDKMVVTFSPVQAEQDGKITMNYKEYYLSN